MGSQGAGGQLTAFMTALLNAVERTPNAAVVYTLAVGKDNRATDAYSPENQFIADQMAEAESVSARKAALLDPTSEDETVKVLRRRLFERIDDAGAEAAVEAYRRLWEDNRDALPKHDSIGERVEALSEGYPLHPELLATFTNKTATLSNFQRVRGMLRLLARTVGKLWEDRPKDALAIHLHHVDPGFEPIRQEITTRLGQSQLLPAIRVDVAAVAGEPASLAQQMDRAAYTGLPNYGSYVRRTILWHTLAFNDALRGVSHEELRYAVLWPGADLGFVDDARKRFVQESAYLDDRPNVPLRFLAEANLTQIIRRQEQQVDTTEARKQLNDRIKDIFKSGWFDLAPFPGGPYDVDDRGDAKPVLVLIGYDAAEIATDRVEVPELVARVYERTGSTNDLRLNRNNLVFLVVDAARKDEMRQKMVRRLALDDLRRPERLNELAEHQREQIRRLFGEAERDVATAIQQAYRHVLYPSKERLEGATVDLEHAAVELPSAGADPGKGQQQVVRALRDNHKLRLPDDDPDSPTYVRDRTPLKKGPISTAQLRSEFRRDPALPMLAADEVFVCGLRLGVESGVYVYQSGDLIWAQGLPPAAIKIDEQSYVMTATYARDHQIWPKPEPKPTSPTGGAELGTAGGDELPLPPGGHRPGTGGRPTTPPTPCPRPGRGRRFEGGSDPDLGAGAPARLRPARDAGAAVVRIRRRLQATRRGAQHQRRRKDCGRDDDTMEVWQLPSPASPHLKAPQRVAGLSGRNLALIEHSLLRRLSGAGIKLGGLALGDLRRFDVNEDMALNLSLLFRTLAPMRSRDNMRACAQGIDAMGREEAAYWLGMADASQEPAARARGAAAAAH
jgi:Protein of unknown function (DUF499)